VEGALAQFEEVLRKGRVEARPWIARLRHHRAAHPPLAEAGWPRPAAPGEAPRDLAAEPEVLRLDREAKEQAAKDPAEGARRFAALSAKFPAWMEAEHDQAVCLAALGQTDNALKLALRSVFDHGARHHLAAGLLLTLGRAAEAIDPATRAIQAEPAAKAAVVRRAEIFTKLQRIEEALADLSTAVALDPEDPALREKRLALYKAKGDSQSALGELDALIAARPGPVLRRERARIQVALSNLDGALVDYDALVEAAPDDDALRLERAETSRLAGHHDKALLDLLKLIEKKPSSADLVGRRGQIYAEQRKWAPAETDLKKALELDPRDFRANFWTGWMLKEMKQAAKSEPFFAKCVELDPKHGESYYHWSQALGASKKYQQSLDAALKAKELCGPDMQSNIEFLIKAAKSRLK
jgi:tetratricopeptide (TPR) repeat protein